MVAICESCYTCPNRSTSRKHWTKRILKEVFNLLPFFTKNIMWIFQWTHLEIVHINRKEYFVCVCVTVSVNFKVLWVTKSTEVRTPPIKKQKTQLRLWVYGQKPNAEFPYGQNSQNTNLYIRNSNFTWLRTHTHTYYMQVAQTAR